MSNVNRYDIVARVNEGWLPHFKDKNANLTLCRTLLLARKLLSKQLYILDIGFGIFSISNSRIANARHEITCTTIPVRL